MKINGNPDGGGGVITGLTATENGIYTPGTGIDGFAPVEVDVQPSLQSKSATSNGLVTPDEGYYGLSAVEVNVPDIPAVTESLSVSENGTYTPGQGVDGYSEVSVNVQPLLQSKSATFNGTIYPDEGYYGLSAVNVDVPQSVTGYTEKELTEGVQITDLNNSASYVGSHIYEYNTYLQTVNLPKCTIVNSAAFQSCSNLTTVNLPECSIISTSAFAICISLSQINIPDCTRIYPSTFYKCTSLSQVSIPTCVDIDNFAFNSCSSLNSLTLCTDVYWTIPYLSRAFQNTLIMSGTGSIYVRSDTYSSWITSTGWSSLSDIFVSIEYSEPVLSFSDGIVYGTTRKLLKSPASLNYLTYLGISSADVTAVSLTGCTYGVQDLFNGCTSLSQVSLPACEELGETAFYNCTLLEDVSIPVCKKIGGAVFYKCTSLSKISLPALEELPTHTFYDCTSLEEVNLPVCSVMWSSVFRNCTNLKSIILGYSGVCSIKYGTFDFTYSAPWKVYVPASLVDAYKSAQYWSAYSNKIFPIE